MKQVILGVYCNVHLDVPVMVPNDLDTTKLTKSELIQLINDGEFKYECTEIESLVEGECLYEESAELLNKYNVGSFKLSKFNYISKDDTSFSDFNYLKKK